METLVCTLTNSKPHLAHLQRERERNRYIIRDLSQESPTALLCRYFESRITLPESKVEDPIRRIPFPYIDKKSKFTNTYFCASKAVEKEIYKDASGMHVHYQRSKGHSESTFFLYSNCDVTQYKRLTAAVQICWRSSTNWISTAFHFCVSMHTDWTESFDTQSCSMPLPASWHSDPPLKLSRGERYPRRRGTGIHYHRSAIHCFDATTMLISFGDAVWINDVTTRRKRVSTY